MWSSQKPSASTSLCLISLKWLKRWREEVNSLNELANWLSQWTHWGQSHQEPLWKWVFTISICGIDRRRIKYRFRTENITPTTEINTGVKAKWFWHKPSKRWPSPGQEDSEVQRCEQTQMLPKWWVDGAGCLVAWKLTKWGPVTNDSKTEVFSARMPAMVSLNDFKCTSPGFLQCWVS